MAPNAWPLGASIRPLHDTLFCKFADPLRTLCGPEAPTTITGNTQLAQAGMCSDAFCAATLDAFGAGAASRVRYTFRGLYDDDLIIVTQATTGVGGNYATAAVGFARGQDFEVVE